MTDLRAAILARCDELRRIAEAAAEWRPGSWTAAGSVIESPDHLAETAMVAEAHSSTAPLIATMDPPAVLALVAGAEEMCELHPLNWQNYCEGCGTVLVGDDPSLVLTAKMIGVPDGV